MTTRDDLIGRYLAYLQVCNQRAWDELPRFVANTVVVNGEVQTRPEYVKNVMATTAAFPDYRWELRRAVVESEWLAVHLRDLATRTGPFRGAPGDGAQVETDEFNMYRIVDGLICEVEGTADNARLGAAS